MTDLPPTIYHLYGDDQLAMEEFVDSLQEMLGPGSNAAMNVQYFSASNLDFNAFEESCLSIPFLTPRRIIVLEHLEKYSKDQSSLDRIFELLKALPPSTALVLQEHREPAGGKRKPAPHPVAKWVSENPEQSYTRNCAIPRGGNYVQWLQKRCLALGGTIKPDAARLLASWVFENPLLADQELRKLIAYVDGEREIDVNDIEALTPFQAQSDIFALVDSIGERDGKQAQRLLVHLFDAEDSGFVFGMIVRQFRLLLIASDAVRTGKSLDDSLSLPQFVLSKLGAQVRSFTDDELKDIYAQLLDLDVGSKTGTIELETGLDALIATIAR